VGSIGVVAQIPNFNRLLKKRDVDVEILTAGKYKRTLTMFGENTDEGRHKFIEDLESVHHQFKSHVIQYRPQLDLEQVATGEHWLAVQALDLGLVDEIQTSDTYLLNQMDQKDIYLMSCDKKKSLSQKLLDQVSIKIDETWDKLIFRLPW
jgi:serine protease SohB